MEDIKKIIVRLKDPALIAWYEEQTHKNEAVIAALERGRGSEPVVRHEGIAPITEERFRAILDAALANVQLVQAAPQSNDNNDELVDGITSMILEED